MTNDIYYFEREHPEYYMKRYGQILEENQELHKHRATKLRVGQLQTEQLWIGEELGEEVVAISDRRLYRIHFHG